MVFYIGYSLKFTNLIVPGVGHPTFDFRLSFIKSKILKKLDFLEKTMGWSQKSLLNADFLWYYCRGASILCFPQVFLFIRYSNHFEIGLRPKISKILLK